MKPATLLRAAAIIALLQFITHTFFFVSYVPSRGPEEVALVAAMKFHRFPFGSFVRSYWDLYFGYGLFAAFNCLIEAILFWQLASLAERYSRQIRPIVFLFFAANIGYIILVLKYFFVIPLIPDTLIAICLSLTLLLIRRTPANERAATLDHHE